MSTIQTRREIFEKNMMLLSLKYPDIAQKVSQTEIIDYTIFKHENCVPNFQHNMIGTPYYIGKINEWCEKQWKPLKIKDKKICVPVFFGFGLGYELGYFLKEYGQKLQTHFVAVIEKDIQAFAAAMNIVDLESVINNDKIVLFVGESPNNLLMKLKEFFFVRQDIMLMSGATLPLYTAMSMKIGQQYYKLAYAKLLEATWATLKNYGNDPDDSLIGVENMLDNLNVIVENPGINLLYDKFKDKPAVIVATGPSLKKNYNLLKDIGDKALIISVDASFHFLMDNGIKPHMVTSLEREHEVEQFFSGHNEDDIRNIYMTTCPVLYNHVYEAYNGPKIIAYRQFDHFKWIGIDKGMLNIKLSSSNMAFKIADKLGCNPIIIIGQDLAYGENNETHVCEVPFSSEGEEVFEVPGNVTEKVKTNSGWWEFLKAYEVDISECYSRVINATEGGAYIQGTEISTLQDCINAHIQYTFNPLEIIMENIKEFKANDNDRELVKERLLKSEKDIEEIIKLCKEAEEQLPHKVAELKAITDDKERVDKFNEITKNRIKITQEYGDTFQLLLMHVCQSVHLSFELEAVKNGKDIIEIAEKYINWYTKMGKVIKTVQKSLLNSKKKLYGEL